MAEKRMGWEGLLYYGPKGSTGSILITNVSNVTMGFETNNAPTTVRGNAPVSPPIETGRPATRRFTIRWTMFEDSGDATLSALKAAAAAGTAVALRGKAHSTGTGPDFDAYIDFDQGQPIDGAQTLDFKTTDITEADRVASLNS
jgi:hypothetical protein